MANRLVNHHNQLHKQLTQEMTRNELVNQAYEKMIQNEEERVGNSVHNEFILSKGHLNRRFESIN